jgi:hypothetical protein
VSPLRRAERRHATPRRVGQRAHPQGHGCANEVVWS